MVANRNLNQTGTEEANVYYVGNILIYNIRYNRNHFIRPLCLSVLGVEEGDYLLLTLNRRVLLNKKENLRRLMETIVEKAAGMPIFAPVHTYVQMCIRHRGMKMPKINIINDSSLNAYASGINERTYTVTLSRGIIEKLDDQELEGVIAHELSHIQMCIRDRY